MRIAGRWPPPRLTRPTPGASESLAARRVSTKSSIFGSGSVGELTAKVRMGASAGLTSSITAPLERQFGQMPGLAQMTSSSSGGASVITPQFSLGLALDTAGPEAQAAINA